MWTHRWYTLANATVQRSHTGGVNDDLRGPTSHEVSITPAERRRRDFVTSASPDPSSFSGSAVVYQRKPVHGCGVEAESRKCSRRRKCVLRLLQKVLT